METSQGYIAQKSKELLKTQVNSYRSLQQKTGVVIAVASLFAPIFIFLIEKSEFWLKIAGAVTIIPLIYGIILLLLTLRTVKLKQGYDETMFEELLNKDLTDIQTYEIAYNKYSIENNDKILDEQNERYNLGIRLIIISIILSISLLLIYSVYSNDIKKVIKQNPIENQKCNNLEIETQSYNSFKIDNNSNTIIEINNNDMAKKKEEEVEKQVEKKVITLPKVNPSKVKQLNEGVEPKTKSNKK